jgi:hypothetical protein
MVSIWMRNLLRLFIISQRKCHLGAVSLGGREAPAKNTSRILSLIDLSISVRITKIIMPAAVIV